MTEPTDLFEYTVTWTETVRARTADEAAALAAARYDSQQTRFYECSGTSLAVLRHPDDWDALDEDDEPAPPPAPTKEVASIDRDQAPDETVAGVLKSWTVDADMYGESIPELEDDEVVAAWRACSALSSAVANLSMFIDASVKTRLDDGATLVLAPGTKLAVETTEGWKEADHGKINRAVVDAALERAINKETGEVSAGIGIKAAIELMQALYVSPSTTPKTTPLKDMALVPSSVMNWGTTGKGWKIIAVADPQH